jgi:DNA-binding winged helix-turn-helix (wHTH) protein/tetratricopeptide (TPR) repeat protein
MSATQSPFLTIGFGVFEVDVRSAELRKHGVRIKLQEQPFQILSLLLQHPGEVVTREELRGRLWPAHTFVDFDRSLNKAMTKLRAALGDSADSPRYIETIPRHGDRFLAPVYQPHSELAHERATGQESPLHHFRSIEKPNTHEKERRSLLIANLHVQPAKRRLVAMAAAIGIATLAVYIAVRAFQPMAPSGSSSSVNPRRSVAVLGFTNLSGDPNQAWLSTAFSDWLATELTAGEQVRAIPAESVARMKVELSLPDMDSLSRESLTRIRKNLGTDIVIVGSYATIGSKPDGQIRLDLRLQDTLTGETIAAISEAGTEAKMLDLVSRAGQHLREKLGVRAVTREEAAEVAIALPTKSESARLYSEGLAKLHSFDALQARDLLQKAVEAEPSYALSHATLATAWAQLGYDENARAEAKRAFDLASNLSRAERLLVEARYHETSREWEKAAGIYRALFEFFPDNLEYGLALANAEYKANKWKDALETLAALRMLPAPLQDDPRIELAEGDAAMPLGDTKRAEAGFLSAEQKARASGASLLVAKALFARAWLLETLGRIDEADKAILGAKALYLAAHDERGVADAETGEAIALMLRGDYLSARRRYQEALTIHQNIGNMHSIAGEFHNLGEVSLFLGDVRGALRMDQDALRTYEEVRDDNGMALAKIGLGDALLAEGKLLDARRMYQESLDTCRRNGDRDREAEALMGLGQVLRAQGDARAAWESETHAKEVFQEVGDKAPEARAELRLAQLLLDRNENNEAMKSIQQAEGLLAKTTSPRDAAMAQILLSQTLLAMGKIAEAKEDISHAVQFAELSHDLDISLMSRGASAKIDSASGSPDQQREAAKRLNSVAQQARTAEFLYAALEARLAIGEMELNSGNVAAGRAHLKALQEEASRQGFQLIGEKARAVLGVREAALHLQN